MASVSWNRPGIGNYWARKRWNKTYRFHMPQRWVVLLIYQSGKEWGNTKLACVGWITLLKNAIKPISKNSLRECFQFAIWSPKEASCLALASWDGCGSNEDVTHPRAELVPGSYPQRCLAHSPRPPYCRKETRAQPGNNSCWGHGEGTALTLAWLGAHQASVGSQIYFFAKTPDFFVPQCILSLGSPQSKA